jgi:hypothetical protein
MARAKLIVFAFYSPIKVSLSGLSLSRQFGANHERKRNLKTYKALRPLSRHENREAWGTRWLERVLL